MSDDVFMYGVYVNGRRVTSRPLSFDEATGVANLWRSKFFFQNVVVDVVERESSEH